MTFRRPGLFTSWGEVAVWLSWPPALLAAASAAAALGPAPARVSAAVLAAGTIGALVAKFGPRISAMRAVAYRTYQGVAYVSRCPVVLPVAEVSLALGKAILAHGRAEALSGSALYVVPHAYAGCAEVGGVMDGGDMTVGWPSNNDQAWALARITHEASHVLLDAAGVPRPQQHDVMAKEGTL